MKHPSTGLVPWVTRKSSFGKQIETAKSIPLSGSPRAVLGKEPRQYSSRGAQQHQKSRNRWRQPRSVSVVDSCLMVELDVCQCSTSTGLAFPDYPGIVQGWAE